MIKFKKPNKDQIFVIKKKSFPVVMDEVDNNLFVDSNELKLVHVPVKIIQHDFDNLIIHAAISFEAIDGRVYPVYCTLNHKDVIMATPLEITESFFGDCRVLTIELKTYLDILTTAQTVTNKYEEQQSPDFKGERTVYTTNI